MANPACTGNGATLTLSVSGWSGRLVSLDGFEEFLDEYPDTALSDTGYERFCMGAIKRHNRISFSYYFDPDDPLVLTVDDTPETVTVSFPKPTVGASVAANLSGLGWVASATSPSLTNNDRMIGTGELRFKGSNLAWAASTP